MFYISSCALRDIVKSPEFFSAHSFAFILFLHSQSCLSHVLWFIKHEILSMAILQPVTVTATATRTAKILRWKEQKKKKLFSSLTVAVKDLFLRFNWSKISRGWNWVYFCCSLLTVGSYFCITIAGYGVVSQTKSINIFKFYERENIEEAVYLYKNLTSTHTLSFTDTHIQTFIPSFLCELEAV